MTKETKYKILCERVRTHKLYTVEGLQRALFALGCSISYDDLYIALKSSGWIKLRLIRDRLLETKRKLPKTNPPFGAMRQLVKWPLQVDRNEDLPEWESL